jgi:hypothetical protein
LTKEYEFNNTILVKKTDNLSYGNNKEIIISLLNNGADPFIKNVNNKDFIDLTTEEKLDFIIEHKNKIFDENFKYKNIYDNIRKNIKG